MSVETPKTKTNRIGLTMAEYRGGVSTLCSGCGHDAITNQIIKAFYNMGVNPYKVAKMSGIGCSSKTPAYFLSKAHGFNGVHGRMPAIATGVAMANAELKLIGVSGDGDTASIGLGQFCHLMRRNVPMIYIIENNGVYGLTKGQFSATADLGARLKTGAVNELPAIDCCALAIELGCSFVARSFAGDPKQLVNLLQAAVSHRGAALLDIISPCVTFNNQPDSTKSYSWAKDHEELLHEIDFVPFFEEIQEVDYEEGSTTDLQLNDGSHVRLRKIQREYDPTNREVAMRMLHETRTRGEFLTGLIFVDPDADNFLDHLQVVDMPLVKVPGAQLRPGPEALQEAMRELM